MHGKLYDQSLVEVINGDKYAQMTVYDTVRLFLITVDKAITKLPWGRSLRFLVSSLEMATTDMALGQLPGLQNYLFTSKASLVRPQTPELALQIATNTEAFKEWPEEQRNRLASHFMLN